MCQPQFGLFNGAIGTVVDIIYETDKTPKDSFPQVVMVEFPKYTGPAYMSSHKTIVPLIPVERWLDCGCCNRKRYHFDWVGVPQYIAARA